MRKIALFFALFAAILAAAQPSCGGCGLPAPDGCADLNISETSCSIGSASFTCRQDAVFEGWLICPSCPEGYSFASCGSSWLFGLFKTTYCTKDYAVSCGNQCEASDNVLSRTPCEIPQKTRCCEIPTNSIRIASPNSTASFAHGVLVNFSVTYSGLVSDIFMDFGDGESEWRSPNINNLTSFSHSYVANGIYGATAKAYTCANCSYKSASSDRLNVTIKTR